MTPKADSVAVLRECPFCGSAAAISSTYDADGCYWAKVKCDNCGAQSRGKWTSERSNACPLFYAEVRDEWNRRTPAPGGVGDAVTVSAILAALNVRPVGQFYPGHTAAESEQANETYYGTERREQVFTEIARLREVERRCWHLLDDACDDGESIAFDRNSPDYRRLDELLPEVCPGCASTSEKGGTDA